MRVLALSNLGTRDVSKEGERLEYPRPDGQRLLAELSQSPSIADQISFPIIRPAIKYIATLNPGAAIDLVLFTTDQDDARYRDKDTLYFGQVMENCLAQKYPGLAVKVRNQVVKDCNPSLYDEVFEVFDRLLSKYKPDVYSLTYAIIGGGTPAFNYALLMQGVRHFQDRLQVIYQLPDQTFPKPLRIGLQMVSAFQEQAAVQHLESLDFANAIPYLLQIEVQPALIELAAYAADRLAFNFLDAQVHLETAQMTASPRLRRRIDRELCQVLTTLDDIQDKRPWETLLSELYWNGTIAWDHHQYAMFLGLVYRFQEAVMRTLVERIYQLSTDLDASVKKTTQQAWEASLSANPFLIAYLEKITYEGAPLNWRQIDRPVFRGLINYAGSSSEQVGIDASGKPLLEEEAREKTHHLLVRLGEFDDLIKLRHRSILGHDFLGISEPQIIEKYHAIDRDRHAMKPLDGMRRIIRDLGGQVDHNPYQKLADFIIEQIADQKI